MLLALKQFIGLSEISTFEEKAINVSSFIFSCVFIFATVFNIVVGLHLNVILLTTVLSSVYIAVFYFCRFKRKYRLATPVIIFTTTLGLIASWFESDGIQGSTPFMLLGFVVYVTLITHGKVRITSIAFLGFVTAACIAIEILFPDLVTPYESPEQKYIDLISGIVVGFVALSIAASVIMNVLYRQQRELESERIRADHLLQNIMPYEIAKILKINPRQVIAHKHKNVAVGFIDIVGFTQYASDSDPKQVVEFLNDVFSDVDKKVMEYGLEKIKTIGDAYMVVGSMTHPVEDPVQRMVHLFEDLLHSWRINPALRTREQNQHFSCRMGIHFGPLVAGVIGKHKYAFDVWGDTVNLASRLEMHGEENQIHISKEAYEELEDTSGFWGPIETDIKGLGSLLTYSKKI